MSGRQREEMETESDEIPGFTFPRRRRRMQAVAEEEVEMGGGCHKKLELSGNAQVGRYEMLTHIRNLGTANRQKDCSF